MKLGWHYTTNWWFGTSVMDADRQHEGRPSALEMYIEGPCRAINTELRTGKKVYNPEENFGLELDTLCAELDKNLDELAVETPEVVTRVDDGQFASYIEDGFVVDNGFLSTSNHPDIAETNRAVSYRITGLRPGCGADISALSRFTSEHEFLFKHGSRFEVLSHEEKEVVGQKGVHYELRFVGFAHTNPKPCGQLRKRYQKCPYCGAIIEDWEDPDESCPHHVSAR